MQQLLLSTQTDERLARLSAGGQAAAFTVLVERHRRSLYRVALNLVSVGEADDVMQQSLLQAWAALQNGAEIRHVRGWLHQIVRHVAIRSRVTHLPLVVLDAEAAAAVSLQPDPEMSLRMRETLASVAELPAKQRLALLRCAVQGESQAAVATELGTTETGVRQLLYRARTSLRAAATALLPFPIAQWAAASLTVAGGAGVGGGLVGGAGIGTASKLAAAVAVVAVGGGATVAVEQQETARAPGAKFGVAQAADTARRSAPAAPRTSSNASTASFIGASASVTATGRRQTQVSESPKQERQRARETSGETKPPDKEEFSQPQTQPVDQPQQQVQPQPQPSQSGGSQPQSPPSGQSAWTGGEPQQLGSLGGVAGMSMQERHQGG